MKRLEQWQIDYIREHHSEHPRKNIARHVGVTIGCVYRYLNRMGYCKKGRCDDAEAVRRAHSEGRRKVYRSEVRRIMAGQPQRTKYEINLYPRKTRRAIYSLKSTWGYFHAAGDSFLTLSYDRHTRRTSKEAYFEKRYGIKFVPADGYEEQKNR